MGVKSSQSGARMLAVLEAIAERQPVGASALALHLGEDRSAVQRSIVTLHRAGWIVPSEGRPVRWELSARLFAITNLPHSGEDLRKRARPVMEELQAATGETVFLALPDVCRFVVVDVVESRHLLRTAPRIGEIITPGLNSTSKAILGHCPAERRIRLLGRRPTESELAEYARAAQQGYGISVGEVLEGATNVAAPIFDAAGDPQAALAISAPSSRLAEDRLDAIGAMLAEEAARLSRRQVVAAL